MSDVVNLAQKFAQIPQPWQPRIVGQVNAMHVKLAKLSGEFIWHQHEAEDELFFVVSGQLQMHFRDRVETINPGEFIIVPRGVEHKPVAEGECQVMLFEPASTTNTGNAADSDRTVQAEWL
ncbi:MAG: cupin domain-containing protein [Anaerolineales bacterium]